MPNTKKPARGSAAKMDAIKLLKGDHAEVPKMFDKYENGRKHWAVECLFTWCR